MTRTKTLLTALTTTSAALAAATSANAAVLLGGYDGTNAGSAPLQDASVAATIDVSATNVTTGAGGGLNSTLWGTTDLDPDADTANGKQVSVGEDYIVSMTVTNNGTLDLVLDQFHVIAKRDNTNSPTQGVLNYVSGDLSDSDATTVATQVFVSSVGPWNGYDIGFSSGLTDVTLAAGESATFDWVITGAPDDGDTGDWLRTDNIAISGSVVPEPGSLALLGLGGLLIGARRRRG